jgi:DnaJ-class molecular chaperone
MRTSVLLVVVAIGLLGGCQRAPLPPLAPGTCPTCRGTGSIDTTTAVYLGESPGISGQPGDGSPGGGPIYRYDISTSPCTACNGTGKLAK